MRDKLLVPPREAAWLLGGISTRHLWSLTAPRGPIPCIRLGRRVFYDPARPMSSKKAPDGNRKRAEPPADLPPAWRPFPVDVLPEPALVLVEEAAASIGVDPAAVAIPCLVGMAIAVGGSRVVRIKGGWSEPAIIWAAVVARSGERKSPPLDVAMEPLHAAEDRLAEQYKKALEQYESDLLRFEAEKQRWKRKPAGDPPQPPERPVERRLVVKDITIEALSEKLKGSPRGVGVVRDELGAWFDGFGKYRDNKASDALQWIECFHGRRLIVDRIQRGTVRIRRAVVSVVGTIQPATLRRHATPQLVESGLIPRLLLVAPPRQPRRWSDAELSEHVLDGWKCLIDRLLDLPMIEDDSGRPAPGVVELSPAAGELYKQWVNELGKQSDEADDELAAVLSKLEGYAARFALVLHLARWAAGENVDPARIDGESMTRAVRLGWWFRNELERVARKLLGSEEDAELVELVELIRSKGGRISARELQRGPRRYRKPGAAQEALGRLVKAGLARWAGTKPGPQGGRPEQVVELVTGGDGDRTPQYPEQNEVASPSPVSQGVQNQGAEGEDWIEL